MKLVIDIDDKTYKTIKDGLFFIKGGRGSGRIMEYNALRAIYDGKPLPKGHWIPVSERLPTKEEYIANNGLFIVSDGNRTYAEYFDTYDSKKFGEPIVFGFRIDKCIIAWMPLPEAYKAESEE